MALIVMEIAYTFAHGKPTQRRRTVPLSTLPKDFEVSGLIDDGLDAQQETQFIEVDGQK